MSSKPIRVLELFSGTHSIGKVCKERGYEVVSLDMLLPADIKADIMEWDYQSSYKPGDFDLITASPVCLYWSNLTRSNVGRPLKRLGGEIYTMEIYEREIKEFGEPMVDKVREILDYFQPKYYWIENPWSGRMKRYITDLPYYVVDYCQYGFDYRKSTIFWTNIENFEPKRCNPQTCNKILRYTDSEGKERRRHTKTIGNQTGELKLKEKYKKMKHSDFNTKDKYERYRIPSDLISSFLDCCDF